MSLVLPLAIVVKAFTHMLYSTMYGDGTVCLRYHYLGCCALLGLVLPLAIVVKAFTHMLCSTMYGDGTVCLR